VDQGLDWVAWSLRPLCCGGYLLSGSDAYAGVADQGVGAGGEQRIAQAGLPAGPGFAIVADEALEALQGFDAAPLVGGRDAGLEVSVGLDGIKKSSVFAAVGSKTTPLYQLAPIIYRFLLLAFVREVLGDRLRLVPSSDEETRACAFINYQMEEALLHL
jgi:hypothetical protein